MNALIFGLAVALFSSNAFCQTQVETPVKVYKVYLDCPAFPVSVIASQVDLKDAFKKAYVTDEKVAELVDSPDAADIEIHVTDTTYDATRVKFIFTFVLHDLTTHAPSTPIPVPYLLPTSLDFETTKEKLALNAGKGIKLYQDINSEVVKNGGVETHYDDPNLSGTPTSPQQTRAEKAENGPYYIQFSGGGYGSIQGSGIYANTSANGNLNYDVSVLKTKYMIDINGGYYQSYNSVPTADSTGAPTGKFTSSSSQSESFTETAVYTLDRDPTKCKGCWGVVVTNSTEHAVASNINFQNTTGAGVEWILYPFKQLQNKELTIKAGPEFMILNLAAPNDLGQINHRYFEAFASIYYYWVLLKGKITATFSASGNYLPGDSNYSSCNGNFNFSFQVTDALSFTVGGGVSYMQKSLTYPVNPDLSNSLQAQLLGGQAGLSPNCSVGVNLSFGNRNQKGIDKR